MDNGGKKRLKLELCKKKNSFLRHKWGSINRQSLRIEGTQNCFLGDERQFCLAKGTGPTISFIKVELSCRTGGP